VSLRGLRGYGLVLFTDGILCANCFDNLEATGGTAGDSPCLFPRPDCILTRILAMTGSPRTAIRQVETGRESRRTRSRGGNRSVLEEKEALI
jgi:hypothetical protein